MNDPLRSASAKRDSAASSAATFVSPLESPPESRDHLGDDEPRVRDVMTPDVRTCRSDRTLVCAATAMHRGDCRFLPIVDGDRRPIATLTDGDIAEIGATDYRPLREILVSEAMSRQVFTCRVDDSLSDVLAIMKQRRIRHLPAVDSDGRLAGVVSLTDVILCIEEDEKNRLAALRPRVATVLRAVSQKHGATRVVRANPFRED
jgi:CBS domain-containing protein